MKNQCSTKFSFYPLEEVHFKDVQYLMKVVFGKRVSIQHLKNKYFDYLNLSCISTIAYYKQHPIGFYGAISQEFTHNGEKLIVAQVCDSSTLKEYQGKGIHYNLAKLSYDIMKANNIKFVYGFLNENSYFSNKKLGWDLNRKMARFHLPIKTFPFAKVYKKVKLENQFHSKVNQVLKPFKRNEFDYTSNLSHQLYTRSFFEYKERIYPHHLVEVEGCVFYLKIDAIMQIGFFTFDNYKKLEVAIEKLKEVGQKLGVNEILFQVSENSEMYQGLKKITSPKTSWTIGYLTFEEMDLSHFEFAFSNLDTF
jgi:hypothetical protein